MKQIEVQKRTKLNEVGPMDCLRYRSHLLHRQVIDQTIQIVTKLKRKKSLGNSSHGIFPLTNSLNVRLSSDFVESNLNKSLKSKLVSLPFTSLSNLCRANPFPLEKNSFNLSDDSMPIVEGKKTRNRIFLKIFSSMIKTFVK